jgi:hypothetical protein
MAEVGSIVVNARMQTQEFTRGSKRLAEDLQRINAQVESGQRSMKAYYQTLARSAERGLSEQRIRDALASRIKEQRGAELTKNIEAEVSQRLTTLGFTSGRGFMDGLKRSIGGQSALKGTLDILRGGGAVVGVALATHELNRLVQASLEIRRNLESGAMTLGEAVEDIASKIPVLGDAWQAGRGIREHITGEDKADSEMNRVEGRGLEGAERRRMAYKALGEEVEQARKRVEEFNRESNLARMPDDEKQRWREIYKDIDAAVQIRKKYQEIRNLGGENLTPSDRDRIDREEQSELDALNRQALDRQFQMKLDHVEQLKQKEKEKDAETEKRMRDRHDEDQRKAKEVMDEIKRVQDKAATPSQHFASEIERVKKLLGAGLITEDEAIGAAKALGRDIFGGSSDNKMPQLRERVFSFPTPDAPSQSAPHQEDIRQALNTLKAIAENTKPRPTVRIEEFDIDGVNP